VPRLSRRTDRAEAYASPGEAFRILRSNLAVAMSDLERPTVIVTSADAGEGKTATTVNLARSLVAAGQRVVLVDLDLRHPDVHHWFGLPNDVGVADVLLDRRPLNECLQYVEIFTGDGGPGRPLYVLPTGEKVDNPAELLGAGRTARMLDALAPQADIVLIDTPPVLLVADTLEIGRMVAGALLVVEAKRTPIPAVQQAKDALIRNQTRLLGLVLNKFVARDAAGEAYGYGAGYGYGYGPAAPAEGNGSSAGR
jgi:capsular exopolysaccharide synthesis family protein